MVQYVLYNAVALEAALLAANAILGVAPRDRALFELGHPPRERPQVVFYEFRIEPRIEQFSR